VAERRGRGRNGPLDCIPLPPVLQSNVGSESTNVMQSSSTNSSVTQIFTYGDGQSSDVGVGYSTSRAVRAGQHAAEQSRRHSRRKLKARNLPGALPALLVLAAALAGCSSSGPGPLGTGGSAGQQCMAYAEGRPVTTGIYDLTNSGTTPVTIRSVALPSGARNLAMSSSWLVPIYHHPGGPWEDIGAGVPYPPATAPQWPKRKPAIRGVIAPGQDLNLVFGLTRTNAHTGRSGGPVIVYSANGNSYTVQEKTSLVVAANCF
jgi:hypothetical protein